MKNTSRDGQAKKLRLRKLRTPTLALMISQGLTAVRLHRILAAHVVSCMIWPTGMPKTRKIESELTGTFSFAYGTTANTIRGYYGFSGSQPPPLIGERLDYSGEASFPQDVKHGSEQGEDYCGL